MTEPFLLSTRALSVQRRARDLVNASMCSASSSAATSRLMNSEPVVGVESVEDEGERPQQSFENRLQTGRLDMFDRTDELELGDLIHQVQVVQALDPVQVALMDRIDSHVAGLPERLRPAAFPNRYLHGARGGRDRPAAPLVGDGVPQVVQVAVGDGGQAFEAGVTEAVEGAGAELAGGRAGERAVERVEFGEPPDVGGGCSGGGTVAGGRRDGR